MKISDEEWNELIKIRDEKIQELAKMSCMNLQPINRVKNIVHLYNQKGRRKEDYNSVITQIKNMY